MMGNRHSAKVGRWHINQDNNTYMKKNLIKKQKIIDPKKLAEEYMSTLIDIVEVARESFLILDSKLRVIIANPTFYKVFRVVKKETVHKFVYQLGNGQWNTPVLKSLLEDILPKKKVVKNFEVTHRFETIGEKSMLLNARQIDSVQLIILAIEDITRRKELEMELFNQNKRLEITITDRTVELTNRIKDLEVLNRSMVGRELRMVELKKELEIARRQHRNGNGNKRHKNG